MATFLPLLARAASLVEDSFVEDVMGRLGSIKPALVLDPDQKSFMKWAGTLPAAIGATDPEKVRRFLDLEIHITNTATCL